MIRLAGAAFYDEQDTRRRLSEFVLSTDRFSYGAQCQEFERVFASWQGRGHCILFNSGSSANLALIQALINLDILAAGDGIAFSAVTWATNVMPIMQLGLTAIPMDISRDTLNVPPGEVARVIAEHGIRVVFLTNLLGFCDDLSEIRRICTESGVLLIEDNCESLGSSAHGIRLGNAGTASTFSFFVGHHMSTIEGGAVCTDDPALAEALTMVRAHGWDRQLGSDAQRALREKHDVDDFYGLYTFYELGYNLRPTEITGFLGNLQMRHLDGVIKRREQIFHRFSDALHGREGLYMPFDSRHMGVASAMAFPLVCESAEIRNKVWARAEGRVEIRPMVGGSMLLQPFFSKWQSSASYQCPVAHEIHERGFYLPIHPDMTSEDEDEVIETFSHL